MKEIKVLDKQRVADELKRLKKSSSRDFLDSIYRAMGRNEGYVEAIEDIEKMLNDKNFEFVEVKE